MPNSETPPKATPGERPCKNAKGTHHGRTYHICVYFYNCLLIPNDLLDNLLHLMILVFATPRWINDLSSHAVLNNLSSHHTLVHLGLVGVLFSVELSHASRLSHHHER
ncbi:uncharacterized protein LOC129633627 isoform X6 [Bubalus kerabau]|uniref:uncharacterized protein LOC129633627 isoform X6 n=1 Tax=Bubalus carabanensis TaxID=3119969 RepID=UPI00244E7F6A|nr:uncharacterized protein LOC129633627 isoform X6 [Bubalus carabanensis]